LPDTGQETLFELQDLSYRTEDRVVLRNIDLTIRQGHTYVITGPSGAGKTTLLRLMCGLS
jgi:ATP-binding cassette subfamily B protein